MSVIRSVGPARSPYISPALTGAFGRVWPFLIYIVISVGVTMSLGQYYQESNNVVYWILTVPLVVLPLLRPLDMLNAARGAAFPAVLFGVFAGGWHLLHGDISAALQAALLAWGLIWVGSAAARLKIDDFYILYAAAVLVGLAVWVFGDLNQWGLLPGTTTAVGETVWRVSFFPNVAYTGFYSLVLIMIATRDPRSHGRLRGIAIGIAVYFIIFSFVRTAVVGLLIYGLLVVLFRRKRSPSFLFWTSLIVAILVNLVIAYSAAIFWAVQNNPLISRMFLRGEAGLSEYEIWQQLYRPYIWGEHFKQFFSSPWLMGWGSVDFNVLKSFDLVSGLDQSGEISLPTRLLAQYGMTGVMLLGYFVSRLVKSAKKGDAWACACFPAILLAMLHWGTMFHPTDAMFGIMMMILNHGTSSIAGSKGVMKRSRRAMPGAASQLRRGSI